MSSAQHISTLGVIGMQGYTNIPLPMSILAETNNWV